MQPVCESSALGYILLNVLCMRLCRHLVHHKCATSYVSCCALLCAILREQYTEDGSLFALRVCCELRIFYC